MACYVIVGINEDPRDRLHRGPGAWPTDWSVSVDERSPETPTAGPVRPARDRTAEREAYREFIQHYGDCPACQAGTACETERGLWSEYRQIRDENRAAVR